MFVIVHNNNVILGPMRWNRFRFENEIQEECDFSVTLQDKNDDLMPVFVSEEIKILPVQGTQDPEFNPKIEFLNGPFWEFTSLAAIQSYRVEPLPIDAIKNSLKDQVSAERWRKENSGIIVSIGGTEYKFNTDKETRLVLQNASVNLDSINWKQDRETWMQLSSADVQSVLSTILSHVQSCFDWEFTKIQEIDACVTREELVAVVITEA